MKKIKLKLSSLMLIFAIMFTLNLPTLKVFAAGTEKDQSTNPDILKSFNLSYRLKNSADFIALTEPYEIPDITKVEIFKAKYRFDIKNSIDANGALRSVTKGDFIILDLPDILKINDLPSGTIDGSDNKTIANYAIEDIGDAKRLKIEFTDYVDNPDWYDIFGFVEFDFEIDYSGISEGDSETIIFPIDSENEIEITITKPEIPKVKPANLYKRVSSYNISTQTIVWEVEIQPSTAELAGYIFTDTISPLLFLREVKHGGELLQEGTDYTFENGTITYTIPESRTGTPYNKILISTGFYGDLYLKKESTVIENQAALTSSVVRTNQILSNVASQTIKPEWLRKSGTAFEGNKINWTITANVLGLKLYDAVITDKFQKDVRLDTTTVKVDNKSIVIYDAPHTPENAKEIYGVYVINSDGTSELKIYLQRDNANAFINSRTVKFTTNIIAPQDVLASDPSYKNEAVLDAKYIYTGSGGGIEEGAISENIISNGVVVPQGIITKNGSFSTAEHKSKGIVEWTIDAASNLSDYAYATIEDTIAPEFQFEKTEFYFGTTKLTASTEPSLTVDPESRKYTVKFNTPQALAEQKRIKVITVLEPEVYATNHETYNLNVKNHATIRLFDSQDKVLVTNSAIRGVYITNQVIKKDPVAYSGNTSGSGQNPRHNFSITLNNNKMSLKNVIVEDDLNTIVTLFKKNGASSFLEVPNIKWTLVPGSLKITRNSNSPDTFDLQSIIDALRYEDNIIRLAFGENTTLTDTYQITFTVELDLSQNDLFKSNGIIKTKGNTAKVSAGGLKSGWTISKPASESPEIQNIIMAKSGIHDVDAQKIHWEIRLNQHQTELKNPRVIDLLPRGLYLIPETLKLYTNVIGADGNFLTGSKVDELGTALALVYGYEPSKEAGNEDRFELTVNLPESRKEYILKFSTDIDNSILGTSISNKAYYAGEQENEDTGSEVKVIISARSGGGSTTRASIKLLKLSSDTGKPLKGAEFELYLMVNGTDPQFVAKQTTNDDGVILFKGLDRGKVYAVRESIAPEGYAADSNDYITFATPGGMGDARDLTVYNSPFKTGAFRLSALKQLTGTAFEKPFTFGLYDGEGNRLMTGTLSEEISPKREIIFTPEAGRTTADITSYTGAFKFEPSDPEGKEVLLHSADFVLKEDNLGYEGYQFDETVYKFTVSYYNIKGQSALKTVITSEDGKVLSDEKGIFMPENVPLFHNVYKANGEFQISGKKLLTGDLALSDGMFSFGLFENGKLIETVKNVGEAINFTALKFSEADAGTLRKFTVKEIAGEDARIIYDPSIYTLEVTVVDQKDGTCRFEWTLSREKDGASQKSDEIVFENRYIPSDTLGEKDGGQNPVTGDTLKMLAIVFGAGAAVLMLLFRRRQKMGY